MSLEEYVKATPYDYDENDNPVYFADMNEFNEYVKNAAKDSVKSEKLIYAIAKNENINVTDEEVEAEIVDDAEEAAEEAEEVEEAAEEEAEEATDVKIE
jgi:FKBP-type peptidyl-prolyl cis-trans isomerase (trigger factor)